MVWKQIAERVVDDVVVFDVRGVIALSNERGRLLDTILETVKQGRANILLNLTDTPYIDSDGLGEIIRGLNATTRAGGALRLYGIHKRIVTLLTVTKLNSVLPYFATEREALDSFIHA